MIRQIKSAITILLLVALTAAGSLVPRAEAQSLTHKFSVTEIKVVGTKNPPNFMEVKWSLTGLKPGARIERYKLTVKLSGNGQTGTVVQTPSPNITSVSVGLLGIPNDTRAKIFGGPGKITARVDLIAEIVQNGGRFSIGVAKELNFNPLTNQNAEEPATRPRPDFETIREGLKKRTAVEIIKVPISKTKGN